ncbi:MAG: hypothetical protein QOF61_2795 [Acidobacteriota bacterium]|jgi:hypothetical protein|nr:hypothetical protein [Acidobacteriota bacterium]
MVYRKILLAACALSIICFMCVLAVVAAGGEIAGTVTDPMGAVVSGAQITATDAGGQKNANATTDSQGRYKVSGLPAGTYVVAVTAQGFAETRQEDVHVEDGKTATANVQMRLPATASASATTGTKILSDKREY